jgi:nucleotide-binding universal stress UspA family protein
MSLFARILVPVDGSAQSRRAIDLALDVARAVGSEVCFVTVVDRSRISVEYSNVPFADLTPLLEQAAADADDILARAAACAGAVGLSARTTLSEGAPVDAICKLAHEEGSDLIVMGSHGRHGFDRFVVGSTTEGVMRASSVPVLVVRVAKAEVKVVRSQSAVRAGT